MSKHTKGPWKITRGWIASEHPDADGDEMVIVKGGEPGFSLYGVPPAFEKKANLRLIAAAPELLAALKAICAQQSDSNVMKNYTPLQNYNVWHAVEAAMAKAEGREPDYSDLGDRAELVENHDSAMEVRRLDGKPVPDDRDYWLCSGDCQRRLNPIEVTFEETCVHCGGRAV